MIATDRALWTVRRRFGVAGGPDEVVLTVEGLARAFHVGAQVRRGAPAEALEALWSTPQKEGYLSGRDGARHTLTELGRRFDRCAWGYLSARGLVELFHDETGDGVKLTEAGKRAAWNGIQERERLLSRCQLAALAVAAAGKVTP